MTSTIAPSRQRPRKPKPPNAIEASLKSWIASLPGTALGDHNVQALISEAPKRWVVYEPMVLLPAGSFDSVAWQDILRSVPGSLLRDLWMSILTHISQTSKAPLTHLAANEGIPLHSEDAKENVLRSPDGLRILHGDFGPSTLLRPDSGATKEDFEKAFWVSTKQNGIYQTWAPRWTMFSRGNVKEKARLLDFHSLPSQSSLTDPSLESRAMDKAQLRGRYAIDLYAGIGYFVFSYAKLGMRILCWELNPWSVEGLRRGALGNGWGVRVVQGQELSSINMEEILEGQEKIVVFLESNAMAIQRLATREDRAELSIRHVNCGFLPTSEPVWQDAWEMARGSEKAWLHLHENTGVHDIETRKGDIQRLFDELATRESMKRATVEHVELVKTFAPGVWHCVFDVHITTVDNVT
ncbi:putative tRNA wybutosine-synthesizing protein 2 [Seiridium cardinale]|uniref:tRNA wybutosine-synthesizing protein 2 n=1 Tax=Seiridium cardinale TaxID=138064 RepID=A0ABR2XWQ0_9PEZI